MVGLHLADAFVDLHFFIADADGVEGCGGFHGDQGHELEHVVLDHVAGCAALVVIAGAVVGADGFADGDLDVVDVFVVPDRLENRVGETHDHQVLNGFLAEIMVDAEDLLFLEIFSRTALRCSADLRSRPKGFSMMMRWKPGDLSVCACKALAEAGDDAFENLRGGGDVEEAVAGGVVGFVEFLEPGGQAGMVVGGIVGAGNVKDVGFHPFPDGFVDGLVARRFS